MSKVNQNLSQQVKKLIKGVEVKIVSYSELTSEVNFGTHQPKESLLLDMATQKACHSQELNLIAVDDDALVSTEVANELVLHELVHLATTKLGLTYEGEAEEQTKECVAQIGMFKTTLVLGLNPAPYADATLEYIKQFPKANFKRVETDSDKVVEYLVKFVGLEKVA